MEIKHVTAESDWSRYFYTRINVINIYNSNPNVKLVLPEVVEEDLDRVSQLHVFYLPEVMGGLLVEQLETAPHFAHITFIGIEKGERFNGYGSALVAYAKEALKQQGVTLVGVVLGPKDEKTFWNKLGYTKKISEPDRELYLLLDEDLED